MIAEVAIRFQNITRFNLYAFFKRYAAFMLKAYSYVYDYYAGNTEYIDSKYIIFLRNLTKISENLLKLFVTFGPKLGNVGYWELQNYCQFLYDTLVKVSKLPKYLRTSKTNRGYKPYVQVDFNVGGLSDFKDISSQYTDKDITENTLILENDFEEEDYEIDTLKNAKLFYNNRSTVVVTTILEPPVKTQIYGKDIDKKITFEDNDLKIKQYEDNLDQKILILLELLRGDVPEFPNLGRDKIVGENISNFNYIELSEMIKETFLQDDLFYNISFSNISVKEGDIYVTIDITTKYALIKQETIVL